MNTIGRILFFSCEDATRLTEKKLNQKISFLAQVRLDVHTSLCKACKNYQAQSQLIEESLKKNLHEDNLELIENDALKNKIIHFLPKE